MKDWVRYFKRNRESRLQISATQTFLPEANLRYPLIHSMQRFQIGESGEFHNDPTVPLMTVADLSKVWLTASVQEKDLRFLTNGQNISASFAAYPGEVFTGKVLFIGDLIDPDIRTAKVRIAFDNTDRRLKPGMFATVRFFGFPEMQITVPTTAVVQSGSSAFVFEQIKPWNLQPQEVKLGAQQGDRIIVTEGIQAGAAILAKEGVVFQ